MSTKLAQVGLTKNSDLPWEDLPPGMGGAQPVAASEHCYTGTVVLGADDAFTFHYHPCQSEYIYVLEGRMEGWVDKEKAILGPGDVMVAPPGMVHACFNASQETLKIIVVLTPLVSGVDEEMELVDGYGWEIVDVSGEEPWRSIR